jgi:hypothetical protein
MKSRVLQFVISILFVMFFIISCEKDTEPETPFLVESVTPVDKGVAIKTDAKIVIKFNKKISSSTQTGTGISIVDKDNMAIIYTASYDGANTLTLTPKESLNSSEAYKIVVKGATAEDNTIVSDFTSSFTVEKIPFSITSITPADKATGVGVNTKIVIVFSKKLNTAKVNGDEFVVAGMNVTTGFDTAYDGKMTITITPRTPMVKSTLYSVFISDLNPLYSLDGDKLEKVNINFTIEK